jgi:hypothetical protein
MNWSQWIRQIHRWLGVVFTVTVVVNIVVMAVGKGQMPPDWVTYSPLLPLLLLMLSGWYLFALPYVVKWRSKRRVIS